MFEVPIFASTEEVRGYGINWWELLRPGLHSLGYNIDMSTGIPSRSIVPNQGCFEDMECRFSIYPATQDITPTVEINGTKLGLPFGRGINGVFSAPVDNTYVPFGVSTLDFDGNGKPVLTAQQEVYIPQPRRMRRVPLAYAVVFNGRALVGKAVDITPEAKKLNTITSWKDRNVRVIGHEDRSEHPNKDLVRTSKWPSTSWWQFTHLFQELGFDSVRDIYGSPYSPVSNGSQV